jgi:hypothetical protein
MAELLANMRKAIQAWLDTEAFIALKRGRSWTSGSKPKRD